MQQKKDVIRIGGQSVICGIVLLVVILAAKYATTSTDQYHDAAEGFSTWFFYIGLFIGIILFSSAMALCHYNIELNRVRRIDVLVI